MARHGRGALRTCGVVLARCGKASPDGCGFHAGCSGWLGSLFAIWAGVSRAAGLHRCELYLGQFSSDNERVADAIEVVRDQWVDIAENGITQDELEAAKTYLTGAYPLRFDGNGRIANIMVGMQMSDLGTDYISTRNDKVNAVTLDQIRTIAARLLQPENLHFVVVGKPEGLETTN